MIVDTFSSCLDIVCLIVIVQCNLNGNVFPLFSFCRRWILFLTGFLKSSLYKMTLFIRTVQRCVVSSLNCLCNDLFYISVDKGLKFRFLLLKLNIRLFTTPKFQSNMINLMRQIPRVRKYVHNSLWRKYLCKVPVVCCKQWRLMTFVKVFTSLLVSGPL